MVTDDVILILKDPQRKTEAFSKDRKCLGDEIRNITSHKLYVEPLGNHG